MMKKGKGTQNILFFNRYDFHISTISIPNYLICTFTSFTQEVFWLHSPNTFTLLLKIYINLMSNNHCLHLNLLGSTKKYFLGNRLLPPLLCLLKRVYLTMITLHYFIDMLVCCNLLSPILAIVPLAPKPVGKLLLLLHS